MTVKDILDSIRSEPTYIVNSLIIKSIDNVGIVYKWLCKNNYDSAFRRQIFIATEESEYSIEPEDRIVIYHIEIAEAK